MKGDGVFELDGTGLNMASIILSVVVFSEASILGAGEFTRDREPEPDPSPGGDRAVPGESVRSVEPIPDAVELARR